jgi:predicted RecB family nuclease
MLRFQGISNEQIDKLIQIGITSSNQLAKASPVVLRDRLLENNSYSETPTLNMIKRWVRIAKELEIIDDLSLRS